MPDSPLSGARAGSASSASLESQTLADLAATLEVENETRWKRVLRYTPVLRELQLWAWRGPWPHELSSVLERIASPPPARPVESSAPLTSDRPARPQACPDAPCFRGLGDLPGGRTFSFASCLSADGTTVGGGSATDAEPDPNGRDWGAFRWRDSTGMVYLGDLAGHYRLGVVNGLSADGEVAVGWSSSENGDSAYYDYKEAFRWTASGGMVALGDVAGGSYESDATAVSGDGAAIAGYVTGGKWNRRAAIWTSSSGWSIVDDRASDLVSSEFRALSRDGRWAAGMMESNGLTTDACRWSQASGFERVGISYEADAFAVSDVGEVVGRVGRDDEWFVASADGRVTILADLPGGEDQETARAILPGGELIVGWGTSPAGHEAVMWDESRTIHRVADALIRAGVAIPAGWVLLECSGIAVNGRTVTLCGTGLNPNGDPEAWIARYEEEGR